MSVLKSFVHLGWWDKGTLQWPHKTVTLFTPPPREVTAPYCPGCGKNVLNSKSVEKQQQVKWAREFPTLQPLLLSPPGRCGNATPLPVCTPWATAGRTSLSFSLPGLSTAHFTVSHIPWNSRTRNCFWLSHCVVDFEDHLFSATKVSRWFHRTWKSSCIRAVGNKHMNWPILKLRAWRLSSPSLLLVRDYPSMTPVRVQVAVNYFEVNLLDRSCGPQRNPRSRAEGSMWAQQDPGHYVTTSLQYLVTSELSLCPGWDGLGLGTCMALSPAPSTEPSASNRHLCAQSLFSCLHKQASFTNRVWIVERRNPCWPESPCDSAFLPSVYENAEIWISFRQNGRSCVMFQFDDFPFVPQAQCSSPQSSR